MAEPTKPRFQASQKELEAEIDAHVDAIQGELKSYFLTIPRGDDFLEYEAFRAGYDVLSDGTARFSKVDERRISAAVDKDSRALVVLRTILGFSPPELAHIASEFTGIAVDQGAARAIDKRAKLWKPFPAKGVTRERVDALIRSAVQALTTRPAAVPDDQLHRLDKIDTADGAKTIALAARDGIPYPVLLYERMLGRPFASLRDSVSTKVGDIVEAAVEEQLMRHGISHHRTLKAESIPGFDQAPDFLIPGREEPEVVIEAKLTEDDGTARDKVTRVQHLATLSTEGAGFEVIACIDGRGFTIRREDMKKLLRATGGKVFSLATIDQLVPCTRLKEFIGPSTL